MFPCLRNLQTKNGTNGKWQLLFVCCRPKTEMANTRLFAANGKGKWKFVSLVGKWSTVIDDCCYSKRAHV
jgi:hypothetical protein